MLKSRLVGALWAIAISLISLHSHAALVPVLGGQVIYDDDLDISWIANTNLAATNTFGLATGVSLGTHPNDASGINGIINADGSMNWTGALFWIDAMNAASYLGFNDWRLPITPQPDPSCDEQLDQGPGFPILSVGSGCTESEMGHLYNIEGITNAAPGSFSIPVNPIFWSDTELESDTNSAWFFNFDSNSDNQRLFGKNVSVLHAWAVRSGNVAAAIPTPLANPLALIALLSGLILTGAFTLQAKN